ncbi:hypothetical protein VNI00_009511 [Paramarasmius palmivorus]|uniref:EKC/KEOPS complex subunit GON7 n=1 Tax=Paramarasmius palmivorus TaxID=297713 RepID=A0AAW0CPZ0_9AGAR
MSIIISYDLQPPSGCDATHLKTHNTIEVPVPTSKPGPKDSAELKTYYASLHTAIETARHQIGEELTRWRDAIGKAELNKETKGKTEDEDDETDEIEEET